MEKNESPLITDYQLEMVEPPCEPGAETWTAKAHISSHIAELLPYLNAEFSKAFYYKDSHALVMVYETRKCSFRDDEITASPFGNRDDAASFIDTLIALANDVWKRRFQIEPSFRQRELPRAMEIFKLLPRTNCGECEYPTCMAFANHLRENPGDAAKCTQLTEENSLKLMELLGGF